MGVDMQQTKMPPAETVHPILKGSPNKNSKTAAATTKVGVWSGFGTSEKSSAAEKKHLTWDEHAIEEHDLLRGTRMKIDEPNTPYTHYDHHSDEESTSSGRHPRSPDENHHRAENSLANQWNDISSKLQAVADKREAGCSLSSSFSRDSNMSDGEEDKNKAEEHEKKFKDMRKKHYNEAEMMRKWREEHANMGDDEEDEDAEMKD